MGRLLWLPDHYREWGFNPIEIDGWKTRGKDSDPAYAPRVFVDHHTGDGTGWAPSLGICINGRTGLPGPLCNIHTPRNPKGKRDLHIVASGRSNNAGDGTWHGYRGNSRTFGNERENRGTSVEPWQPWQTEDAVLAAACFIDGMARYEGVNLDASYYAEHKEWAPGRKVDAHTINGADMRKRLAQVLSSGPNPTPEEEYLDMFFIGGHPQVGALYVVPVDLSRKEGIKNEIVLKKLEQSKAFAGYFEFAEASMLQGIPMAHTGQPGF